MKKAVHLILFIGFMVASAGVQAEEATTPSAAPADATAAAPATPAVPVPTAEEIQKVSDYFNQGKDQGPVLVKLTPCLKVEANNCVEAVSGKIKAGTKVSAHMVFLVPVGGTYSDLSLQWSLNGTVRSTKDLEIKGAAAGSMRYRMMTTEALSKVGTWEARLLRGDKELAKFSVDAE